MSEATLITPKRTVTDKLDDLNLLFEGISTVGLLLGGATIQGLPDGTISAAGYLIVRMADDAKAIADEIG